MKLRSLLLSGIVVLFTGSAMAEGTPTVVRVFDHLVAFDLPEGFVAAHEVTGGGLHYWHALPAGETMENWTQSISLVSDPERGNQDPSMGASLESSRWHKLCKDTFEESAYGSKDIPGTEQGSYGYWVSCGTRVDNGPPRSEDLLFLAISGPAMSILGWSKRGPAMAEAMSEHDDDTLDPRIEAMTASVKVCKLEEQPYTKCLAK